MLSLLTCMVVSCAMADYPPLPESTADTAELGKGIQRTMRRLADSTKEKRNRVRILFYGQSITEQDWWKQVVSDLKTRFPHADIVAANKAIGGFSSQRLIHTWEADVIPFAPDLVVFHVYGDHTLYDKIIHGIRSRTAADVLMQKDHAAKWPKAVAKSEDSGLWWDNEMNTKHLPAIAKKYDCGFVDVRGRWVDYLNAHKLEPKYLLKDGIHLNDHGNFVMAKIISRYLVRNEKWPERANAVEQLTAGEFKFEGCRIDTNTSLDAVRIDGKPVAEFPSCYAFSRCEPGPWSKLFLMNVSAKKPLVAEKWTLTVTDVSADKKQWKFMVSGSVTGDDGEGSSMEMFESKSGRCVIKPEAWFANGGPAVGDKIQWDCYLMAKTGITDAKTLTILGLPQGPHTLSVSGPKSIVTIYRPGYRDAVTPP